MQRYRQLLPYIWSQWRGLLVIGLFTALSSALAALQPWPLKIFVDHGLTQEELPLALKSVLDWLGWTPSPRLLLGLAAAATLLFFALASLCESVLTWRWTMTGQRMVGAVARDLFHRFQHVPLLIHQSRAVGDSLSRLTADCWCVYKLTDGVLISPFQKLFTLVTLGAVAWQLHPSLALCALITAPLMGCASAYFGRRIRQRARHAREVKARLLSFVHQTLSAIPIVQAFATEARNRQRYQDLASQDVLLSQRGSLQMSAYRLVTGLITTAGLALIVLLGATQVRAGTLSLGSFLVFLAYMRTLQNAAESLVDLYTDLKPVEASMDRVLEVLKSPSEKEYPKALPWPNPTERGASLRMDGVCFGYAPGRTVLEQINLQVAPGEIVAIVGSTGAGKTTLLSLLTRLFDPWEGRILINGTDLRHIRLVDLRQHIAVVPQEALLLQLSVAENIAFGRPSATRGQIEAASRAACADEFVRRLPRGYDTVLGSRGATLSVGQRHRLALARAYLKDAPLLILDEPTAALDSRTETSLLQALEQVRKGRTVFVIAHRLSTIRRADQILVLAGGRIVQRGRHEELVAAGGAYEQLHQLQSVGPSQEVLTV